MLPTNPPPPMMETFIPQPPATRHVARLAVSRSLARRQRRHHLIRHQLNQTLDIAFGCRRAVGAALLAVRRAGAVLLVLREGDRLRHKFAVAAAEDAIA